MSDFSSDFWAVYISLITVVSIIACAVLLYAYSSRRAATGGQSDTTGHTWDEDLSEWNNPLPRWWMWLFYITIVFSLVYLALYPGLGTYAGALGWSSRNQYDEEQKQAAAQFGPIFDKYLKQDLKIVAADPAARAIGQRLFLTNCSQCHGSDAGGGKGFPNLRDNDWLYGGDPETIKESITNGRNGVMPPMGAAVGGAEGVKDVAHYVLSLSGRAHDELRAARGKPKFATICIACHGPDGKGNQTLGAPNLTDDIWLYGGREVDIIRMITEGEGASRASGGPSVMPAHKNVLDEAKIHLLAAYVYSLSQPEKK
jgi:cytochrome c oxidase cbb3-type subunit III